MDDVTGSPCRSQSRRRGASWATASAREQLRMLVDDLSETQADRALTVLEVSGEWILTGNQTRGARPTGAAHLRSV